MFEVIPNWHPFFVHFTIALLLVSVVFFVLLKLVKNETTQQQIKTVAYWNLWLGTAFAAVTVIAGWYAYNTVAHDTPSHLAMTDHRNWALATFFVFIIVVLWSIKEYKNTSGVNGAFVIVMLIAGGLLLSTGYRGGEAVYRHGLGVMSLPKVEGEGHAHEHAEGEGHEPVKAAEKMPGEHISSEHMSGEHMHDSLAPMPAEKEQSSETVKPVIQKPVHDHSTHQH